MALGHIEPKRFKTGIFLLYTDRNILNIWVAGDTASSYSIRR